MLDENSYKEGASFDLAWVAKFELLVDDMVDELNLRDQQLSELSPMLASMNTNLQGVFG